MKVIRKSFQKFIDLKMTKKLLIAISLFFSGLTVYSQEVPIEEEDPEKIVREVVKLEVDRAKFAPKPVAVAATGKKGKKKVVVEEPVAVPDTGNPLMPAPIAEVLKRSQHWYKLKNKVFHKAHGTNSGNSVSCNVSFPYKEKVFNPQYNLDGKITMDILIEAKDGKYRYTIKNIKHMADKSENSGEDIFLLIPKCGSGRVEAKQWVKIKAEALADASKLADDLKAMMKKDLDTKKDDW